MPKGMGYGNKGMKHSYGKKAMKKAAKVKNAFSSKKMAAGPSEVSPSHKGYA